MAKSSSRANRRDTRDYLSETAFCADAILKRIGTRVSRLIRNKFLAGDHDALLNISVDPTTYDDADKFSRDWLAVNLLGKYPGLRLSVDPEAVAWDSFFEAEDLCRATNIRLQRPYDTPTLGVSGESLIESARLKIRSLLGDFSWDDAEPLMSFSSGASTRLKHSHGDPYFKYRGKPEVTRHAALVATVAIWRIPRWRARMIQNYGLDPSNWFKIAPGNRLTTVPKNSKTDRCIAVEPDMNMFLQRGIGGLIRKHLRRVGVNLNDQTLNQRLALEGSLTGKLATLDLKAASDSVSTELVRRLLPPSWFTAMDMVRSHTGTLIRSGENRTIGFHKFSSMGNGFTFELESLIFWALASSVTEFIADSDRRVAVYGDDIIVPTSASGFLTELLEYVGFRVNVQKSFERGPFRESCGKHYFRGRDVTPMYIRKVLMTKNDQYWMANAIRRFASQRYDGAFADSWWLPTYEKVIDTILKGPLHRVPAGTGDGGLASTFSEALPSYNRRKQLWQFKLVISGCGLSTKHFEDPEAFYLRYMQGFRRTAPYECLYENYRSEITALEYEAQRRLLVGRDAPPLGLCIMREKKWTRVVTAETSRWDDAPMWV